MNAYAPSLHRTSLHRASELRGADRALVRLGTFLADVGRRHAAARADRLEVAVERSAAARRRDAYQDSAIEHRRDNAAVTHPLLLR